MYSYILLVAALYHIGSILVMYWWDDSPKSRVLSPESWEPENQNLKSQNPESQIPETNISDFDFPNG